MGVTQLNFHTLVDRDLYADLKCGGVRSNQNVGCLLLACWLPGTDQQRSHPNVVGPYRATNKQATSNQRTKNRKTQSFKIWCSDAPREYSKVPFNGNVVGKRRPDHPPNLPIFPLLFGFYNKTKERKKHIPSTL